MLDYLLTSSLASWKAATKFSFRAFFTCHEFLPSSGNGALRCVPDRKRSCKYCQTSKLQLLFVICCIPICLSSTCINLRRLRLLIDKRNYLQVCCIIHCIWISNHSIKDILLRYNAIDNKIVPIMNTTETFCFNIQRHKCQIHPRRAMHYEVILSAWAALKASRADVNLSVTTSQRSIKASKPFSRASTAVVVSATSRQLHQPRLHVAGLHTIGLDTQVHLGFRRMRDRISAELNLGTERDQPLRHLQEPE